MSDQNAPKAPTIQDYPKLLSEQFDTPGIIILSRQADGVVHMVAHGVNNAQANEMLSIGIYCNLDQHYRNIEAGIAGQDAQRRALELAQLNKGGE